MSGALEDGPEGSTERRVGYLQAWTVPRYESVRRLVQSRQCGDSSGIREGEENDMSSTHTPKRTGPDFYETPSWCTRAIMPYLPQRYGTRVLEPGCGRGAIVKVLREVNLYEIDGVESEPEYAEAALASGITVFQKDFLRWQPRRLYDLAVGNPPYNSAIEFIQQTMRCLVPGGILFFLLRVGIQESATRWEFMSSHTPDQYVLPQRPSFEKGATDSACYAWLAFHNVPHRDVGSNRILGMRPKIVVPVPPKILIARK